MQVTVDYRIFEVWNFFKRDALASFAHLLHAATSFLNSFWLFVCVCVFAFPGIKQACKQLEHSDYMKTTDEEVFPIRRDETFILAYLRSNPMRGKVDPSYADHSCLSLSTSIIRLLRKPQGGVDTLNF